MTYNIEKDKWILYRHTRNLDLISAVAVNLKSYSKAYITEESKRELLLRLKSLSHYRERNPEMPLDAINHKINTLAYYMFGYKKKVDGVSKFLFSPLGNLFIKHLESEENVSKIFFSMLWGIQFPHPHGGTKKKFQLYPFRLLFRLLNDKRLDNKLYAFEVAGILVFEEYVTDESYEKLVQRLLVFRALPNEALKEIFKTDEHVFVNSAYEWDYYLSKLLNDAGVVNRHEGEVICKLEHGNTTPKTYRKVTRSYVEMSPELEALYQAYQDKYPFTDNPLDLNDPERLKDDVVKEIYSFYPDELLDELNENEELVNKELLELPELIDKYANNLDDDAALMFEKVLVKGFNMFVNVDAKWKGGPGQTDIECIYIPDSEKFSVDAKSTKNKLSRLNAGRLSHHRGLIGGKYTIVITPRYVPAVKHDIKDQPIVIILASTFSEFLYNSIIYDDRELDYNNVREIVLDNLGSDISKSVSDLTATMYGTSTN